MSRRRPPRRVPSSRDPHQVRSALRGLDGGPQLLDALDAVRARQPDAAVVLVNNADRGPAVVDARGLDPGSWVVESLIPTGVIAAIADLDDPSPATLLAGGFDVVLHLCGRGAMLRGPVLLRVVWRPGLVPGREPPSPFMVRFDPARLGFVRVDAERDEEVA